MFSYLQQETEVEKNNSPKKQQKLYQKPTKWENVFHDHFSCFYDEFFIFFYEKKKTNFSHFHI